MKKTRVLFICVLCTFIISKTYAQVQDLIANGSFEARADENSAYWYQYTLGILTPGSWYPGNILKSAGCVSTPSTMNPPPPNVYYNFTGDEGCFEMQLFYCDQWLPAGLNSSNCGDWFTDLSYNYAMQGAYNWNTQYSNDQAVADAPSNGYPIMQAHTGHYFAGTGGTEGITNRLFPSTPANGMVKLSFWYSPRGKFPYDIPINIILAQSASNGQVNNGPTITQLTIQSPIDNNSIDPNPGQWYYMETGWIKTGSTQYDRMTIQGAGQIGGWDFTSNEYFYIDDVQLLSGCENCIPYAVYQNTTNLPSLTTVSDYIEAGSNVLSYGNDNVQGPVIVEPGQNVIFQAGNKIILNNGFSVASGGNFLGKIEECDPLTSSAQPITVSYWPNIFTPNGDGINDLFVLYAYNAQTYDLQVYSRWGGTTASGITPDASSGVYAVSGVPITYVPINLWDGKINEGSLGNGNLVADGTYYYIITLHGGCGESLEHDDFITVLTGGHKAIRDTSQVNINFNTLSVSPNPTSGIVKISMNQVEIGFNNQVNISVYDVVGNLLSNSTLSGLNNIELDFSNRSKGVYLIRISVNGNTYVKRVVVI